MDWNLFWNAFSAIGTTVGSLITACAVIVAVVQYRQPLIKKLRITTGSASPLYYNNNGEMFMHISIANVGIRPVTLSNIYLHIGNHDMIINKIMLDFASGDMVVHFPIKLEQEKAVNVMILYSTLSSCFYRELTNGHIEKNECVKVKVTDTSGKSYFGEKIAKVYQLANYNSRSNENEE